MNIYFFYYLSVVNKSKNFNVPYKTVDFESNLFLNIEEQLLKLPRVYRAKNPNFLPIQLSLIQSFNSSETIIPQLLWQTVENWDDNESLYPDKNGMLGHILRAMQTSPIVLADNAPKGTQLKLLLEIEGKQKLLFKPKRYNLTDVIPGVVYSGFDRHNSEVFAYYLAVILNMKWISPSMIRKINIDRDIIPNATPGLKRTTVKNANGKTCIYGKCYYCKINETVCPNSKGEIEGTAILYKDKQFRIHRSPWSRSYKNRKMEWEIDNDYCKKVRKSMIYRRILNFVDIAIFDFLIQNGDRHGYEVYKDKIVLLDNGKGLGNPFVDTVDILAPLYQCCIINSSTWRRLELISGGSLTESIKLLASIVGEKIATEEHYQAVERRLLKVYAVMQYCFSKYGEPLVLKNVI